MKDAYALVRGNEVLGKVDGWMRRVRVEKREPGFPHHVVVTTRKRLLSEPIGEAYIAPVYTVAHPTNGYVVTGEGVRGGEGVFRRREDAEDEIARAATELGAVCVVIVYTQVTPEDVTVHQVNAIRGALA